MSALADTARLPAWPLRLLWPRHTTKHGARRFRVAIDTVKEWLIDGVPLARRAELAAAIEAELSRIERDLAALREARDWLRGGADAVARPRGRRLARPDRPAAHALRPEGVGPPR
jgi:hypothetical protein